MDALDMVEDDAKPQRAFSIVLTAGADTKEDLAWELRHLADQIERDKLTVGCIGGPSAGSVYSYRKRPVTHDAYFSAINEALAIRNLTETPDGEA